MTWAERKYYAQKLYGYFQCPGYTYIYGPSLRVPIPVFNRPQEEHHNLLSEMRMKDAENHFRYLRMSNKQGIKKLGCSGSKGGSCYKLKNTSAIDARAVHVNLC